MELNTDLTMSSGNNDYRGDIMMSTQDLDIAANREVVQFKTDLTITSFSDDTLVSEMKTDLAFSNNTMMFSVINYAEVRKSILYFSKFFNVNFEEAYLWKMLAEGTSEQINASHLADVYTAINNLAAKLNNFLEGTNSDDIINTWKELQEFLKGISGVQDLYSLIKSMVTYENIMPLIQDHFIRKDQDDTTPFNITFANSAKGAGITLGDRFEEGVTGGRIHAYYDRNNTLQTSVEVDYLTVRKKATFTQLTIEELKSVGGSIILSPAAMECSRVEIVTLQQSDIDAITQSNKYLDSETGEYVPYCKAGDIVFRCYFTKEDEDGTAIINQFVAGDQAKCQTFNASNIYDYTDTSDLSGNRYYWRLVVNTGEDFIDLSQDDKDTGSDVPVLGDTIVQLGHRYDPTRQAAQILSAYGTDAPSHRMYQGVGSTMYFASNVEGEAGYTSGPYDLYGKDVYGLYYNVDSATPGNSKMMQYTYGDWYVGTRNQNHRDSDTTYIKFDTEKKQLSLRGVLVQSQYDDDPQPIEFYRGTYTLENPNCDLIPYYWMDTVTYVSSDGTVGTYIHTGRTTTTGVRPDDTSAWTAKVLGSRGESAITFDLSNEIDAVALDSDGKTLGDELLETTINFHVGLTKVSPLKSVSYTLPDGWVDQTDKDTYLSTGKLSFKVPQGTVLSKRTVINITVQITYNGTDYSDTKSYTLAGVEGGANVKLYSLSLSDSVVAYNPNSGIYTPKQITVSKKVREGGSAPASTTEGRILCEFIKTDGTTETEYVYEGVESKTIYVNKVFTKLVISYYVQSGSTYVMQDQETIPFLQDGKNSTLKPYTSYFFAYSKYTSSSTSTTPPQDLDAWTEAQHSYWYDVPPEYPLPQAEVSGTSYYLWMCVVYYRVNTAGDSWEVDTTDNPITYKRVEGETGPTGSDGTKSPYTEYSFAYSTNLSTTSSTTSPTIAGSWSDGTPEKPSDYETVKYYLWMKIQKMKAKLDNSGWEADGIPTYARVDGEKGDKGDKGDNGKNGNNVIMAELSNDADYIMTGSDGILNISESLTTTTIASLYDGTDNLEIEICKVDLSNIPTLSDNTKLVTASVTYNSEDCTITFTIKDSGTLVLDDEYKIPITLIGTDANATQRTCTYTLAFVKKGEDGESYSIVPSAREVKYYTNASTPYFSPTSLTCKVIKKSGKRAAQEITSGVTLEYFVDASTETYIYDLASQTSLTPNLEYSNSTKFKDKVYFKLKVDDVIVDTETVYIVKDGSDGKDGDPGSDGDSIVIVYKNSKTVPDIPSTGKDFPPSGWRTSTSSSGTKSVSVDTSVSITNKVTKNFNLTVVNDSTSAYNGYYKITGITSVTNTLQCVKISFKSIDYSSYRVKIHIRTNSGYYDRLYVGKLDTAPSTSNYTTWASNASGSDVVTFTISDKTTHYVYVYYIKNQSTASYTDSVYFKPVFWTSDGTSIIEDFVEEGTLYSCTGTKSGKTGIITWNTPQLSDYGDTPIYSYCGEWKSTEQYKGDNEIIHIVCVSTKNSQGIVTGRKYYKAIRGVGYIPIGVSPETSQKYKYINVLTYGSTESTNTIVKYERSSTSSDKTISTTVSGTTTSVLYYSWINGTNILYTTEEIPGLSTTLYTYNSSTSKMTAISSTVKKIIEYGGIQYGSDYWASISQYSSVATDLLLAENAVLDLATVRKLITADKGARVEIQENYFKLYDGNNNERLYIIGDEVSATGSPSSYSIDTSTYFSVSCTGNESRSGQYSFVISRFYVGSDNTSVTIPDITLGFYTTATGGGGTLGDITLSLIVKNESTGSVVDTTTKTDAGDVIYNITRSATTSLFTGGSYVIEASIQYQISATPDADNPETTGITLYTDTSASGVISVGVNNTSDNKISIGSNGLVANLGNNFSVQLAKFNGESVILLQGANASGNVIGLKITSAGVYYAQDGTWTLIGSGGGSTSSGNVSAVSSLSSGSIILGNGGYNIKSSSYTPSGSWVSGSSVTLPSCAAIETYVKNNSGSSGLTSVGISVPTGLTVSNSPLTSDGIIKMAFTSGYSIPKTSDVNFGVEAYNNMYTSIAAPPVLNVIRTYDLSYNKDEFLRIFHPLLTDPEYSAVLMVYSRNTKTLRTSSGDIYGRKRKRGWALAVGDFAKMSAKSPAYSYTVLETVARVSKGIAVMSLDDIRNHIIPRYTEWEGRTTTSMTYTDWTADSTTVKRGFTKGYSKNKKFGIAIRKINPDFTAIAKASSLKDNTMSLQDSSGRIVYRYLYSAVAPLNAQFSSDRSTNNNRYLYFGVSYE